MQTPNQMNDAVPRCAETAPAGGGADCRDIARRLNRECRCTSLDRARLRSELLRGEEGPDIVRIVEHERPHLFSDVGVFVGEAHLAAMAQLVVAVERVVALPAYRARVLDWAPDAARHDTAAAGVFMGFDFHLGADGPRLIEINTNAGGGMLNALLARAQQACCAPVAAMLPGALEGHTADEVFFAMFMAEWRAVRGDAPPARVAIVDDSPAGQFLYPEFVLFQHLFERHGLRAQICDARALRFDSGRLLLDGAPVDLVYNRHTDFGFEGEACAALREAWLADAAVITPHPRAHALYADKRNLVLLTDEAALAELGVDESTRHVLLEGIPRTVLVRAADAERFWGERRQWFFKPAAGYGSKAAYRGDKLTRRVFEDLVLAGDYIAQALVPPSGRLLEQAGASTELKLDLRNYVYCGAVQLVAARLYQGQTTNFRTPGGGFAPVLAVPCGAPADCA